MEKQPQFIKEFSRQASPAERSQAAQEIFEKRASQSAAQAERAEQESEAALLLKEIETLRDQVESYNTGSFLGKIKDFLAVKKIKAQLAEKTQNYLTFEEQLKAPAEGNADLQETQRTIANFYDREKQKWAESPYAKEDLANFFNEENLSALSVEDYALLLRRFPGNMVTHVTRQGVRDHCFANSHTKGLGEFQNNFKDILKAKRLCSSLGMKLQESSKEELIAGFLDEYIQEMDAAGFKTDRGGALTRINSLIGYGSLRGSPYNFADRSAIHVATEEVADAYYGGERGNEIFFAFPSAFVASQMDFGGQLKDASGGSHNDQRVWADLEKGMNLDAGLVFIPADARVGKTTGSKYEIGPDNQPIISGENVATLKSFAEAPGFAAFAERALQITGKKETDQRPEDLAELRQRLKKEFHIEDAELQGAAMDYSFLRTIKYASDDDYRQTEIKKAVDDVLMSRELLYPKAKDTVSSKEYWESFFTQQPEQRPSKIVYYHSGDPTAALDNWRTKHKIGKRSKEEDIGFAENKKGDKEMNESAEQQRFMSIAKKLIDERFPPPADKPEEDRDAA